MRSIIFMLVWCLASPAVAERMLTSHGQVNVDNMASGLDEPWAVGFLPNGGVLVTERGGRLLYLTDEELQVCILTHGTFY